MRVAVTGGCGFIGSHVVDHLVLAGHDVRVIDKAGQWRNPEAEYVAADIFDAEALDAAVQGTDAVFHLAGAADVNDVAADPARAVRLNVEGVARILDAARNQGTARVLLASTVWVYGATVATASGPRTRWWTCAARATCTCPPSSPPRCSCTPTRRCSGRSSRSCATASRTGRGCGTRSWWPGSSGRPWTASRSRSGHGRPAAQLRLRRGPGRRPRPGPGPGRRRPDARARGRDPGVGARDRRHRAEPGGPGPGRARARAHADYEGVTISNRLAKELLGWSPVTSFAEGVRRYLTWLGEGT